MPPLSRRFAPDPSETVTPPSAGSVGPAPPVPEYEERLRRLLPQLRTLFRYTEYTQLARHRVEGPIGVQQRFAIPGDRWLDVTPDELLQQGRVRMHVRLVRGTRAEMNANLLASPGAPAIFGGPPYGNGVLIIILWANPNPAAPDKRAAPPGKTP